MATKPWAFTALLVLCGGATFGATSYTLKALSKTSPRKDGAAMATDNRTGDFGQPAVRRSRSERRASTSFHAATAPVLATPIRLPELSDLERTMVEGPLDSSTQRLWVDFHNWGAARLKSTRACLEQNSDDPRRLRLEFELSSTGRVASVEFGGATVENGAPLNADLKYCLESMLRGAATITPRGRASYAPFRGSAFIHADLRGRLCGPAADGMDGGLNNR